ncbi:MAG: hypothetical protein ACI4EV_05680, partial [Lachnospiraceae bacterium]
MNGFVDEQKRKKLITALVIMIGLPVVLLAIWAVIVNFIARGSATLGTVLIIVGALVCIGAAALFIIQAVRLIKAFEDNISTIANGDVMDNIHSNSARVNEMLDSVRDAAVSYAKIITSIKDAVNALGNVSNNFKEIFSNMTGLESSV